MSEIVRERLDRRSLAVLRAVSSGRAELSCNGEPELSCNGEPELSCNGEPDLFVDGLGCCDQFSARRLIQHGLITGSLEMCGQRMRARLTALGDVMLNGPSKTG